jgi:cytochrome c-type biogenesis protein CcsB
MKKTEVFAMKRRIWTLLLGSALLLTASPGFAQDSGRTWEQDREFSDKLDLDGFRQLAIQEGGRRKPVGSFANEFVFKITDRKSFQGLDPLYMVLSMTYELREQWLTRRFICVRNLDLIKLFLDNGKFSQKRRDGDRLYVSIMDFQHTLPVQRIYAEGSSKAQKKIPRNDLEKSVLSAGEKIFMIQSLSGMLTIIPRSDVVEDKWTTISTSDRSIFSDLQTSEQKIIAALRGPNSAKFNDNMGTLVKQINAYDFKAYPYFGLLELEHAMNTYKPFKISQLVYLLAIIFFVIGYFKVSWARTAGFVVFSTAMLIHIGALTGRGFLVGRSPVASLYETLLFMTGFAALMAFTLELIYKREGAFALGASVCCMAGLFLGDWHPIYYDKQAISPLVPVLRSYWLNIHVSCMIASYGACLLAAAIGFVYMWRWSVNIGSETKVGQSTIGYALTAFRTGDSGIAKQQSMIDMDHFLYRAIQVGFLLLTIGVILGGVWANQSWGRYWDWDPKETWAFITWVVYAVYLHLRLMGIARGAFAAAMSLIGFWFVMFTYLGVSYVLPGLHSYVPAGEMDLGHMAPFIISPFATIALFAVVLVVGKSVGAKAAAT